MEPESLSKPEKAVGVGKALKSGHVGIFAKLGSTATAPKAKGPSWRERLEEARKKKHKQDLSEESDISEDEEGDEDDDEDRDVSEEDEFSEWGGIASEHEDAEAEERGEKEELNSEHEEEDSDKEGSGIESEVEERDNGNFEEVQRRAKEFKDWAREQSGLGASLSNISSLPKVLPSQLRPPLARQEQETVTEQSLNSEPRKQV